MSLCLGRLKSFLATATPSRKRYSWIFLRSALGMSLEVYVSACLLSVCLYAICSHGGGVGWRLVGCLAGCICRGAQSQKFAGRKCSMSNSSGGRGEVGD